MKRLNLTQRKWAQANWILAGILLVQVGLAAWLLVDNYKAGSAAGQAPALPLVANLAADDVSSVRIGDATGSVLLAKGDDGWSAPEADGYPVTAASVTKRSSRRGSSR